jgi:hypothetical protein
MFRYVQDELGDCHFVAMRICAICMKQKQDRTQQLNCVYSTLQVLSQVLRYGSSFLQFSIAGVQQEVAIAGMRCCHWTTVGLWIHG